MVRTAFTKWQHDRFLIFILAIGLIHGVIYTFLIPPWQHYDEPTHFEYAWLIANTGKLPQAEAYDSVMRREVTASMIAHGFFDVLPSPNLLLDKTWIGISQTSERPLYYAVLSLPLMLLKGADVVLQLYTTRLMSVFMFLGVLFIAHQLTKELFPNVPELKTMIPLSLTLTPSFVDLMSAVNNDVGATLMFSLFIWLGVRLISPGGNVTRLILFILGALVCFYTKTTVFVAMLLVIPLISLTFIHTRYPINLLSLSVFCLYFVFIFLSVFAIGDSAYWYRNLLIVQQNKVTREKTLDAVDGQFVLSIQYMPEERRGLSLYQPLDRQTITQLSGHKYTLGAWLWASRPVESNMLSLWVDGNQTRQVVQLTTSPQFVSFSNKVPSGAQRIQVLFDPIIGNPDSAITIFADGIILTRGEFPPTPPLLQNNGTTGKWGKKDFANLIRNPSAEQNWLTVKPKKLSLLREQTSIPYYALSTLQDRQFSAGYYRAAMINLFQSFWARFGWNHVTVPEVWYRALLILTLIGITGTLGAGAKILRNINSQTLAAIQKGIWMLMCLGIIWSATIARQSLPIWNLMLFTPSARYAYPVIIPTMMTLVGGWYFLSNLYPKLRWVVYLPVMFLMLLSIYSIAAIFLFYYSG